ncbi:alpha/beta hydrolase [Micromonospora sp. WMMD735]|uniref:alpha/beta hydrolase n=1 Tax=Micromonospora sp. WMMD735 TaxID=3404130 RepID=UPI003B945BC9
MTSAAAARTSWRDYDRHTLDLQYSPSSRVRSLQAYLDEYVARSAAARAMGRARAGLPFGIGAHEKLDFFPADAPTDAALVVFVHGGNWQALSRTESAFAAPAVQRAGAAFAAIDYGLAPQTGLPEMIASVRRSLTWLAEHAGELGFSPRRIHVAGSSAGAHLTAAAVLTGWAARPAVAGCVLLSGMYDLEPVQRSYVNEALGLDMSRARLLSPVRHLASALPPVVIARGDNETEEYQRQHGEMVRALRGRTRVTEVVAVGRNHFDLPYDLAVPGSALGDAVLRQMGLC